MYEYAARLEYFSYKNFIIIIFMWVSIYLQFYLLQSDERKTFYAWSGFNINYIHNAFARFLSVTHRALALFVRAVEHSK